MRLKVQNALTDYSLQATSFACILQIANLSFLIDIWLNYQNSDKIVLLLCLKLLSTHILYIICEIDI